MKFIVKHDIPGRIRVHLNQKRMTYAQAEILYYAMMHQNGITHVKVYERTCDMVLNYNVDRNTILDALAVFEYEKADVDENAIQTSHRELNAKYYEKLVMKFLNRFLRKWIVPYPLRTLFTLCRSACYIQKGIQCLLNKKIEVPVLDATAIAVSVFRGDFKTASSVMFMLGIGELLEEWTHKKSVSDLARCMSLNVNKVWMVRENQEILVNASEINPGDHVVIRMGNVIPFDGVIRCGEAMVNQSSLTGESIPVHKEKDGYVYAGTVVEDGEIHIEVRANTGSTRYEKIVQMIEESEKLKSGAQSKAEHLADQLVPYTLAGTGLVWLFTRNVTKALSVLMVDFSCALKLAMPIAVLSAIREANAHHITVKGGKYLETVAEATTIVFDKTGTLTKAQPTVKYVIAFGEKDIDDYLRIAACMEEHFPHSMAKAVVQAAKDRKLEHEEMHSKVDYIVAHGISSYIKDEKVIIGSYHFVFEDEGVKIREEYQKQFETLPDSYSHLYMAIDGYLEAVICIEDPLRREAPEVISTLRQMGFTNIVMMTGDSERTACAVAKKIGVDVYYSEVLPEDKARFIEEEKKKGIRVIMIGDGINDSPALSAADVGIAISDGAEIAREIADITISTENLQELVLLKELSVGLSQRIRSNYRKIVGFNTGLILFGVCGWIQPTVSAFLHNASTLGISLASMNNILDRRL